MFILVFTLSLMLLATHMISKKFGIWAGMTVAAVHIFNIIVDSFVDGDLTTFRLIFNAIFALLLIVGYYKTVDKLNI